MLNIFIKIYVRMPSLDKPSLNIKKYQLHIATKRLGYLKQWLHEPSKTVSSDLKMKF